MCVGGVCVCVCGMCVVCVCSVCGCVCVVGCVWVCGCVCVVGCVWVCGCGVCVGVGVGVGLGVCVLLFFLRAWLNPDWYDKRQGFVFGLLLQSLLVVLSFYSVLSL